ncbi:hypothetical protein AB4Z51_03350 [Bradyrhizobium sp. 2TAF36]|uniref:hypothetical protein n=1 Tax=Bradyrhizobium sp. 2TAF36 TaxID=3233016 RepID=UPI003F8F54E0
MGKADDVYTPEQRALIRKMTVGDDTPEQRAKLDKARRAIDDYVAIRDNQKRPPWAEGPQKLASPDAKAKSKPEPTPARASKPLPRRKPGPRPKKDWPKFVKKKVRSLKLSGKPIPTAPAFLQLCENELEHQPDIRQMQRLLKALRA